MFEIEDSTCIACGKDNVITDCTQRCLECVLISEIKRTSSLSIASWNEAIDAISDLIKKSTDEKESLIAKIEKMKK